LSERKGTVSEIESDSETEKRTEKRTRGLELRSRDDGSDVLFWR
jgi:hypothetical protein